MSREAHAVRPAGAAPPQSVGPRERSRHDPLVGAVVAPTATAAHWLHVAQRSVGNRATGRLIQAKLRIGAPGDRYEAEADRIADLVVSPAAPVPSTVTRGAPGVQRACCSACASGAPCGRKDDDDYFVQRRTISAVGPGMTAAGVFAQRDEDDDSCTPEAPAEEEKEDEAEEPEAVVSRKALGGDTPSPDAVERDIQATRGDGSPLPPATRGFMESRFGYDFSAVRVHTDARSTQLNRTLRSHAFTTGTDIYFAPGRYRPGDADGNHLLAHELTHVVQQAGGGGAVQEKAVPAQVQRKTDDDKPYYHRRDLATGTIVHIEVERRLRNADKNLVTEAPIPGAIRWNQQLNLVGSADLYRATPDGKTSGVKGYRNVADEKDVVAMDTCASLDTKPCSDANRGPTRPKRTAAGTRTWTGDFPSSIEIGELKPAGEGPISAGVFQLRNYELGFKAFVERVHTLSGGATAPSIGVSRLSLTIPPALQYNPDPQSLIGKPPKDALILADRRYWIWPLGDGVYVYFHLTKHYEGPPPDKLTAELQELARIKNKLLKPDTRTTDKMDVNGKFLPGGPPASLRALGGITPARPRVQRKKEAHPPGYWRDRRRAWEKERRAWADDVKKFLKGPAKAWREKARLDKSLGLGRTGSPAVKVEVEQYKQLTFWSGRLGQFLGKIRFFFGAAFDKVFAVFEKMREKMTGVRAKLKAKSDAGFALAGWRKTLIALLFKTAKLAISRFVAESFNLFVECIHHALDTAVEKLRARLTEKFAKDLCETRKKFEDTKDRLEKEWGGVIDTLETIVRVVGEVNYWMNIATTAEALIRLGIQVVSCLTPPALGCLWGLIVQVGLEAGLSLLVGTQWFNDNIINPTIRNLVREHAGPLYENLVNRALGPDLKEYHCHLAPAGKGISGLGFLPSVGLKGSALVAHRNQWEQEHMPEIKAALQPLLVKTDGKPADPAEVRELLKQLDGLTPDEIQAILRRASRNGKVSIALAKNLAELHQAVKPALEPVNIPGVTPPAPPPPPPTALPPLIDRGTPPAQRPAAGTGGMSATTGTGSGASGGTADTDAGAGPPILHAVTSPPQQAKSNPTGPKRDFTYMIAQGLTPRGTYTTKDVYPVTIDVFYNDAPDYPVTIEGVSIVYLQRRKGTAANGRARAEFEVYFQSDWYVAESGAKVFGGPGTKHWYSFEPADSR